MLSVEEINELASKGKAMPKFESLPEMYLYETLSALYIRYRLKQITVDNAKAEKAKIIGAYERLKAEYDKYLQVYKDREKIINDAYQSWMLGKH